MDGTDSDNRVGLVQEVEIVRAARDVILNALTNGLPPSGMRPDGTYVSVELAKWVIENIWTPELEPID